MKKILKYTFETSLWLLIILSFIAYGKTENYWYCLSGVLFLIISDCYNYHRGLNNAFEMREQKIMV